MEREGIASPELASPDFFTPEEISEHDFVALLSSEQRELLTTLRSVLNAAQVRCCCCCTYFLAAG